ncbi:hypothetical protein evm_006490 [Chilo suppressalis]|nr:hypothetical protein evm_006490 [Chilo suppressalis]
MIMYEANESDDSYCSSYTNLDSERDTTADQTRIKDSALDDFLDPDLTLACQTYKNAESLAAPSRPVSSRKTDEEKRYSEHDCYKCENSNELYCHVDLNTILKLKESTKKLLTVLDEIQSKTHANQTNLNGINFNFSTLLKPTHLTTNPASVTDLINENALKKLENQAKNLDSIYIQDEDDDCSVYKRLTRKCHCLNHHGYNDFMIHFNEDTKYRTSVAGELIKNMRILKKFLYMNGDYTMNALLFLNEGLADSTHTEKVEIIQACAHADICNVFEDHSIVVTYISWPCKYVYYGDNVTQALTASFLNKMAQLEEGRRYLNYSSKIANDLKRVIRKKSAVLEIETVESLNTTLNLLNPPLTQNMNITYYYKPIDEGMGKRTLSALVDYHQNMTLDEVFAHLNIILDLSNRDTGKFELTSSLHLLLLLFKRLLIEYDNSGMNIILTKILTNILTKNKVKQMNEGKTPKALIIADVATEPIQMKNEMNQHPPRKPNIRKSNKSKLGLSPNKLRNTTKERVSDRHVTGNKCMDPSGIINRSRKFNKGINQNTGFTIYVMYWGSIAKGVQMPCTLFFLLY